MLTITVPGQEYFDEEAQEFITHGDSTLEFEHSLVSISKWESKFKKSFLGTHDKTTDEVFAYIEAMILTPNTPGDILQKLSQKNVDDIQAYIEDKMTATWFMDPPKGGRSGETITSELIYYWMISFQIPFECEKWHLNRLLTLIKVCSLKNSKPKKMSRAEIVQRNRELNAQRKAKLGTTG